MAERKIDIAKLPFSVARGFDLNADCCVNVLSGQIGHKDGKLVEGGLAAEMRQIGENIKAILESLNANMGNVIKTTVYLVDKNDFDEMNEIYAEIFKSDQPYPARTTVGVAWLPLGAKVEIEAWFLQ